MGALDGKVVLVTGASRGIGYAAALEAARRGAHVIAVARTVGGLEELDDAIKALGNSGATLVPADLRDGDGIDRLGRSIFERWGKLYWLVANAGVLGTLTPVAHLDPNDFDRTFAINVTSNYRLIRSLDVLLRQADAGRAVFVSSGAAHGIWPFWGLYAATKAALEALVRSYAEELNVSRVKANVFYPGAVRTAMRHESHPGEDKAALTTPEQVAPALIDMILPGYAVTGSVHDFKSNETRGL